MLINFNFIITSFTVAKLKAEMMLQINYPNKLCFD